MTGWLVMNGSAGCLPDNVSGPYEDKDDAIDDAGRLFDDLDDREHNNMVMDLRTDGIHYFPEGAAAGADYVEVAQEEPTVSVRVITDQGTGIAKLTGNTIHGINYD